MLSNKKKLAKPVTNNAIGVLIEPTIATFELSSTINVTKVIPQTKNIKDSYKLLSGKYPKFNHRRPNKRNAKTLAHAVRRIQFLLNFLNLRKLNLPKK